MKPREAIAKARWNLCRKWKYTTPVVMSLVPVEKRGLGTLAVDKYYRLYYDPVFVTTTTIDMSTVVAHETGHIILRHHVRAARIVSAGNADAWRDWNVAADAAVNDVLESDGFVIPDDWVTSSGLDLPKHKSVEFYYRELRARRETEEQAAGEQSQGEDDEKKRDSGGGCEPDGPSDEPEEQPPNTERSSDEAGQDDRVEPGATGNAGEPDPVSRGQYGSDEQEPDEVHDGTDVAPDGTGGQCLDPDKENRHDDQDPQPGTGGSEPGDGESPNEVLRPAERDGELGCVPPEPGESGSCSDGRRRPWEDAPPHETDDGEESGVPEAIDSWDEQELVKAVAEKMQGNVGGHWKAFVDEMLHPNLDPRRLLINVVSSAVNNIRTSGDDMTSYRRPSRRGNRGSLIRPSRFECTPRITIVIDTSGSMENRNRLPLALGLVSSVLAGLHIRDGIKVVCGDTDVSFIKTIFDPSKILLRGGGGTNMASIMESAADDDEPPDLIVLITDGMTPWPYKELPMPVVCCLTNCPVLYKERIPNWIDWIDLEV